MSDQAPRVADFQAVAQQARNKPTGPKDRIDVIEQTLSQALLLLGSMQGGGALRELQQQFMQQLVPFRPPVRQVSFLDMFSGDGDLARYLKDEANFQADPAATEEDNNTRLAVFRNCAAHAGALNYFPYHDQRELEQLNQLFAELVKTARSIIPQHFNECAIQGGIAAALTQNDWIKQLDAHGSGFYENRQQVFNPDGSVPWVLYLKKSLSTVANMAKVVVVMLQGHPPQMFIHHAEEDVWYGWDGKTLLPGLVDTVCGEYAWAKMLSLDQTSGNEDWFGYGLKRICEISRSYSYQHNVLPSQTFFKHEPNTEDGLYADFMHVEGSCRLTVRTKSVWMVVYGTDQKTTGWDFTVRYNRPQVKETIITIPVEESSLTVIQKRVLLQRAFRALAKKVEAIEYEQKRNHEEKESA